MWPAALRAYSCARGTCHVRARGPRAFASGCASLGVVAHGTWTRTLWSRSRARARASELELELLELQRELELPVRLVRDLQRHLLEAV